MEVFSRDALAGTGRGGESFFPEFQCVGRQNQIQDDSQQKQAGQACQQKYGEKPDTHLTNPPNDPLIGQTGL